MNRDYFILCEDDHQFTEHYNYELLTQCIKEAKNNNADIICGSVSWFEDAIQISERLFWTKKFSGTQFIIIFRKFYQKILDANFEEYDAADYRICSLSNNIYFIHPFISVQKEFGYSDATTRNDGTNRVEELFATTESNVSALKEVKRFYKELESNTVKNHALFDFDTISIPAYIINLPERTERREHIINQFKGKKEFDVTIVHAVKHEIGAVGLWKSIRNVIQLAIDNEDDVIIICEDDHEFTEDYSKEFLLKNVIEAHEQGCNYLTGGTGKFDFAIPVAENRYWTNHCLSTQFIVLYRKFFQKILDEPYDDTIIADIKLSEMTSHKMILFPFVSLQHDFGYSDITSIHNEQKGLVQSMFAVSQKRLAVIQQSVLRHCK